MPIGRRGGAERWKRFTAAIKKRDRYRCRRCGAPGKRIRGDATLTVHHVKPFADRPELEFDPENCVTLCDVCHGKIDGPRGIKYGH